MRQFQAARPEGWTDTTKSVAVQGPCLQSLESLLIRIPYYNVLSNYWTANYLKCGLPFFGLPLKLDCIFLDCHFNRLIFRPTYILLNRLIFRPHKKGHPKSDSLYNRLMVRLVPLRSCVRLSYQGRTLLADCEAEIFCRFCKFRYLIYP